MALVTGYASLQTEIASTLARSDLTSDIPGFIQRWEERFYRQPKNFGRFMEASFSSTIASSVIAAPSDYLGLKYAYVNTTPSTRLDRVSLNQLYGTYPRNTSTGLPRWISRDLTNFVFGPEPDSTYAIAGVYYAKPTVLRSFASDAAAHFLIVNAPDLAVYGACLEATPFLMNDKRLPTWQAMYGQALQDYRDLNREEDYSGSPIQEVLA